MCANYSQMIHNKITERYKQINEAKCFLKIGNGYASIICIILAILSLKLFLNKTFKMLEIEIY